MVKLGKFEDDARYKLMAKNAKGRMLLLLTGHPEFLVTAPYDIGKLLFTFSYWKMALYAGMGVTTAFCLAVPASIVGAEALVSLLVNIFVIGVLMFGGYTLIRIMMFANRFIK